MLANTVLKAYAKAGDPIGALDWVQAADPVAAPERTGLELRIG